MADQVSSNEQSVGSLIKDIIHDVEQLTQQQFKMFRREIKEDVTQAKEGAAFLSSGFLILLIGGVLLGIMLAQLLIAAELPAWAAYGLIGILAAIVGAILCFAGQQKLKAAVPPAEESIEALEENVKCLTHPK
jgi:protein-S-isoprenylcysteine O-methyltransferase Ste14